MHAGLRIPVADPSFERSFKAPFVNLKLMHPWRTVVNRYAQGAKLLGKPSDNHFDVGSRSSDFHEPLDGRAKSISQVTHSKPRRTSVEDPLDLFHGELEATKIGTVFSKQTEEFLAWRLSFRTRVSGRKHNHTSVEIYTRITKPLRDLARIWKVYCASQQMALHKHGEILNDLGIRLAGSGQERSNCIYGILRKPPKVNRSPLGLGV
jgi:hypothetical protein